jgi:hypothetical protein
LCSPSAHLLRSHNRYSKGIHHKLVIPVLPVRPARDKLPTATSYRKITSHHPFAVYEDRSRVGLTVSLLKGDYGFVQHHAREYDLAAAHTLITSCPLHGLVLTHPAQHSAPKRHARYTPMPPLPGVSFLCSERSRMVKTLRCRSGEKPIPLRYSTPDGLPHSIPQPPQPARFL